MSTEGSGKVPEGTNAVENARLQIVIGKMSVEVAYLNAELAKSKAVVADTLVQLWGQATIAMEVEHGRSIVESKCVLEQMLADLRERNAELLKRDRVPTTEIKRLQIRAKAVVDAQNLRLRIRPPVTAAEKTPRAATAGTCEDGVVRGVKVDGRE